MGRFRYREHIPITAEKHIIRIGCTFLKARISIKAKMHSEIQNSVEEKACTDKPVAKKTVFPTETTDAPIIPTTAGFSPDMQPDTIRLLLNFS